MDANAAHGSAARSRGHRVIKYVQPGSVASARGWVRAAEVFPAPLRLVSWGKLLFGFLLEIFRGFWSVLEVIEQRMDEFVVERAQVALSRFFYCLMEFLRKPDCCRNHTTILVLY